MSLKNSPFYIVYIVQTGKLSQIISLLPCGAMCKGDVGELLRFRLVKPDIFDELLLIKNIVE